MTDPVLVEALLARTEQRDDARNIAVALENRLAQIRESVTTYYIATLAGKSWRDDLLRLIDAELRYPE